MNQVHPQTERGYSLVEVLVVIVILGVVSTGLMVTFITGQREYNERDATIRMQQQARFAMADMERNTKMAGYGLMDMGNLKINVYKGSALLSPWLIMETGDGVGGGPDTITFRYQNPNLPTDMDTNIITLTTDYPSSKPSVLPLSSSTDFQVGDLLIIYDPADPTKPASLLQVSNIPSSGDKVDHNTSPRFPYNPPNSFELFPQTTNGFATNGYGLGSRVINLRTTEMLKVTYYLRGDQLVRDTWSSVTDTTQTHVVATGIEDLQIRYQFKDGSWLDTLSGSGHDVTDLRSVRISIIARTAKSDARYQSSQTFQLTGPMGNGKAYSGGGYRRMTMSTMVSLRNLAMRYTP